MSVLTYETPSGTIVFGPQGWETLSFDQEPYYESSQTDCLGTRIVIAGSFLLSEPVNPMKRSNQDELDKAATGQPFLIHALDPAEYLPRLRWTKAWSTPRGRLSFKVNDVEMMPSSSSGIDCKNGPIPGKITIQKITESTFRCHLSIVSHWAEISSDTSSHNEGGRVLSSRWREKVTIDQDQLTTRARQGKVIVSSNAFPFTDGEIDKLRDTLITCSILPGFIRTTSDYELSENGLELTYNLVDVEQFRMCPLLTTFAEGSMQVSTQRMGTPGRNVTVSVALRGPKKNESHPTILGSLASDIAIRKARLNGGFFAQKMDFRESMWKNEVSVTLQGMIRPPKKVKAKYRNKKTTKQEFQKFLSFEASLKGFGKTVKDQVGSRSPDPGTRGTANVLLHAAAYQDPTLNKTLNRLDNSLRQVSNTAELTTSIPGG